MSSHEPASPCRPPTPRILLLCSPRAHHHVLLRAEIQHSLAIGITAFRTRDIYLVFCAAECGKRNGDGHVDADLNGFSLPLEELSAGVAAYEVSGPVAVAGFVKEGNGIIKGGDVKTDKDRAEDFPSVPPHVRCDIGDDGRGDLKASKSLVSGSTFAGCQGNGDVMHI